jgi:hypothetical protein
LAVGVGGQVADLGQRLGDLAGGFEARRVEQVVDLAGAVVAAVDRRDLDGQDEANRARAAGRGVADENFE